MKLNNTEVEYILDNAEALCDWLLIFGDVNYEDEYVYWNIPCTDITLRMVCPDMLTTHICVKEGNSEFILKITSNEDGTVNFKTNAPELTHFAHNALLCWQLLRDRRVREVEGFPI